MAPNPTSSVISSGAEIYLVSALGSIHRAGGCLSLRCIGRGQRRVTIGTYGTFTVEQAARPRSNV
jgi:hypothetical protein